MRFYENQLFHIYNQGNNRQQIFFSDENYHFFLWRMRGYLLPFGDFIGWALMPNHYHWLFYVRKIEITRNALWKHADEIEFQRRIKKYGLKKAMPVQPEPKRKVNGEDLISLNESIGIIERSYAAAINKQNESSGSLFRQKAKAKDGWINEFITETKANGKKDPRFMPGNDYGYKCLMYLHDNAKTAGLVTENNQWKFSSARDYAGLRKGSLCNLKLGHELINFI